MSWFRLDDGFSLHPKVLEAGNAAVGLFVRCCTYCACYETDGHVPLKVAQHFGTRHEITALIDAGLWVRNGDGGFHIPSYLEFNPSKAQQEERREDDRKRQERRRRNLEGQFDVTP